MDLDNQMAFWGANLNELPSFGFLLTPRLLFEETLHAFIDSKAPSTIAMAFNFWKISMLWFYKLQHFSFQMSLPS